MRTGLYSPDDFKDNCGFGLIAHVDGLASHRLLETAIESLTCMTHRGGIASDGKTGDGCGLLLKKPDSFLKAEALRLFNAQIDEPYAVGQIFLNADTAIAAEQMQAIDSCLATAGLETIGWREVPVNAEVCGEIARANLPTIQQVFVKSSQKNAREFDVALYVTRKKVEMLFTQDEQFYVCSLSATVLSYKGLIMPSDIANFYLDLANPELETAICIFHQRFSTNTLPKWPLAQPFRALAHNGEINTIMGNRNWAAARASKFSTPLLPDISELGDLVNTTGSDSSSLDNMLELLTIGGMDIHRAIRTLVPPAWQNVEDMDADLRAFYDYSSMHMEPWDGPAGMVMTDGRYAICMLDRNGLRPARWVRTTDGFITVASEIGTYNYLPEDVIAKGRVGPGQILSIDTESGVIRETRDVDNLLKRQHPYKEWLRQGTINISSANAAADFKDLVPAENFEIYQKYFNVSFEERDQVIRPMVEVGQEATGSMGDDTPMAVLSRKERSVYDYFRQQFAQVTNPPIDPLREAIVMSLFTCVGAEKNVFDDSKNHAQRIVLSSPVLSPHKFSSLLNESVTDYKVVRIDLCYKPDDITLKQAVETLVNDALAAVKAGAVLLVLSDRNISSDSLAVHSLIATGAVHHALIANGLRCDANIIVESASARDSHHFATLIGFGATAIYPYLSYSIISDLIASGEISEDENLAYGKYRKGINKGLLKIMSKMGISTIASYRGAQLFEAVGLASEVVDLCFKGVTSRIQGSRFSDLESDQRQLAKLAWTPRKALPQGGLLKYVHGEEYHAFNPDVITTLQEAVQTDSYSAYKRYADMVNTRPVSSLRDLLGFAEREPIALDEVESIENILRRFDSAGMSLGALSPEAHEALATAMNRLGCRSNSGEGGEDPARYGTERMSKIKQIASGRFGVTPHYLVNAEVLQIKVAQGAKPGEGGQLPGGKVNSLIAELRYSVPGVTLISPPPHHDIYSIEDLAQLIFDLKQVNPSAQVSVKLVSEPGVGTIAAGVAKAYADLITISGYDGGTAASPLTSIRYAGSPWELGLSEAHQALRGNGLRGMVRVQTDGGLKTGVDVIKAAILGAESFGFGTTPMVALGCKYLRICHLNNCATGVATQQEYLRDEHFIGTVQMVMNFFTYVATETREVMAQLGIRSIEELIGQTELLTELDGQTEKQQNIDLSPLLFNDLIDKNAPHVCQVDRNKPYDEGLLAERMVADSLVAIEAKESLTRSYNVTNCDRSIGARLSGEIAKRHGNQGYAATPLQLSLTGTAGQSFGVWNAGGLEMTLEGDANDYVGKGMAGGKLVIFPPKGSVFASQETAIIGNTCLYGATGGTLFAAGIAGERFAVRNSGASAVIEGAGDHCCEYMTGGCITVLGKTGYNFGAGMTGGLAYVLDVDGTFVDHVNQELVEFTRITSEAYEVSRDHLRGILNDYALQTGSEWGQHLSLNFDDYARRFWLVKPKAASVSELIATVSKRAM